MQKPSGFIVADDIVLAFISLSLSINILDDDNNCIELKPLSGSADYQNDYVH